MGTARSVTTDSQTDLDSLEVLFAELIPFEDKRGIVDVVDAFDVWESILTEPISSKTTCDPGMYL